MGHTGENHDLDDDLESTSNKRERSIPENAASFSDDDEPVIPLKKRPKISVIVDDDDDDD